MTDRTTVCCVACGNASGATSDVVSGRTGAAGGITVSGGASASAAMTGAGTIRSGNRRTFEDGGVSLAASDAGCAAAGRAAGTGD
ncbi:hypothetical protein, partial [Erwinia mallotivora]|uniref:hypothetical protein n=1 Tax=Erwinia mallotivora TaxID=69222 RepID=UPI0021BFBAD7